MPGYEAGDLTWKQKAAIWLLSLPTTLVVAGATSFFAFLVGANEGTAKKVFIGFAVFFAIVTALISYLRTSRIGVLRGIATRVAGSVLGSGRPVLLALGEMVSAETADVADTKMSLLQTQILLTAQHYCGATTLGNKRAVLYLFDESCNVLLREEWTKSRDDKPREQFDVTDVPLGRSMVEFAKGAPGQPASQLVTDTKDVEGINPSTCCYKSFISAPLIVNGASYGFLSVDSTQKNSFAEIDQGTLSLLAGVLVAGLAARPRLAV